MIALERERNPLVDLEFLRLLTNLMKESYFHQAAITREIFSKIRLEDMLGWPIFQYLLNTNYRTEIGSLLFEIIKTYSQTCTPCNVEMFIPDEEIRSKYYKWDSLNKALLENRVSYAKPVLPAGHQHTDQVSFTLEAVLSQ